MSDKTGIAWTDATWNPVRGCTKVSAGCAHCYAETFAERWRGISGHPYEQGFDVRLVPEALDLPLRWRKPRRVFVNSMSDLFHEDVPDSFIQAVFTTMAHYKGRQHTYQILTKRPARMQALLSSWVRDGLTLREGLTGLALPNVWLGVSVENQAAADERIPHLLATPAAVRFVSLEPLLGSVDLMPSLLGNVTWDSTGREVRRSSVGWVIVGGESGPKARPCDVAWIRSIVQQCAVAGTACFVKQLGANVEDRNDAGFDGCAPECWPEDTRFEDDPSDTGYQGAPVRVRLRDRSGADPSEWPEDLRVRQMPLAGGMPF